MYRFGTVALHEKSYIFNYKTLFTEKLDTAGGVECSTRIGP